MASRWRPRYHTRKWKGDISVPTGDDRVRRECDPQFFRSGFGGYRPRRFWLGYVSRFALRRPDGEPMNGLGAVAVGTVDCHDSRVELEGLDNQRELPVTREETAVDAEIFFTDVYVGPRVRMPPA